VKLFEYREYTASVGGLIDKDEFENILRETVIIQSWLFWHFHGGPKVYYKNFNQDIGCHCPDLN
jgi:hypothetical protein